MRLTRADRSVLSDWWFTIDRLMLSAVLLLMLGGLVLSMAASPPIADKLGLEPYHFVKRHALFLIPASLIVFAASLLNPKQMRRLSLGLVIVGFGLMVATLITGPEIKGATRWLQIGPFSLQPSELVKPGFVVVCAWLFSESQRRKDMPGWQMATGLYVAFVVLLVLQPDFGQVLLVSVVWGGLFFLAGLHMVWVGGVGRAGAHRHGHRLFHGPPCQQTGSIGFSIRAPGIPISSIGRCSPSSKAVGSAEARARAP